MNDKESRKHQPAVFLVPCFASRYVQRYFLLITTDIVHATDLQYFQTSISVPAQQLVHWLWRAEVSGRQLDGDMAAVAVMPALLLLALMAEVGGDSDTPGDMFPR